jgi:hypothetical protein
MLKGASKRMRIALLFVPDKLMTSDLCKMALQSQRIKQFRFLFPSLCHCLKNLLYLCKNIFELCKSQLLYEISALLRI